MQTTTDIANTARTATTARERFAIVDRLARKGCSIDGLHRNDFIMAAKSDEVYRRLTA